MRDAIAGPAECDASNARWRLHERHVEPNLAQASGQRGARADNIMSVPALLGDLAFGLDPPAKPGFSAYQLAGSMATHTVTLRARHVVASCDPAGRERDAAT